MENTKLKTLNFKNTLLITIFITLFFLIGGPLHSNTFLSVIPYKINGISVWQNVWKIIWAGLAFVFITYYNKQLTVPIKEMFNFKKINLKIILIMLSAITLIDILCSLVMHTATPDDFNFFRPVINFFFVGLTEEIIYRGWAMNAFSKVTSVRKANIIQSFFFMLVHLLPWCFMLLMGWGNISDVPILSLVMQLVYCMIIGCVLGGIFNKTHSLWTTVIIHCLNDVIATFFGLQI